MQRLERLHIPPPGHPPPHAYSFCTLSAHRVQEHGQPITTRGRTRRRGEFMSATRLDVRITPCRRLRRTTYRPGTRLNSAASPAVPAAQPAIGRRRGSAPKLHPYRIRRAARHSPRCAVNGWAAAKSSHPVRTYGLPAPHHHSYLPCAAQEGHPDRSRRKGSARPGSGARSNRSVSISPMPVHRRPACSAPVPPPRPGDGRAAFRSARHHGRR